MKAFPQRAKLLVCVSLMPWSGARAQSSAPAAPPIKIAIAAADPYAGESLVIDKSESL